MFWGGLRKYGEGNHFRGRSLILGSEFLKQRLGLLGGRGLWLRVETALGASKRRLPAHAARPRPGKRGPRRFGRTLMRPRSPFASRAWPGWSDGWAQTGKRRIRPAMSVEHRERQVQPLVVGEAVCGSVNISNDCGDNAVAFRINALDLFLIGFKQPALRVLLLGPK